MATNTSIASRGSMPALLKYKIVFLGDQAVGKSSILNRYIYDIYDDKDHRPTIGIDFISQNIHLEEKTVRLQLWDTAGQQRFKALIPNYIRDAAVAVIVFDVSNKSSFVSVTDWLERARAQSSPQILFCLLANKIDVGNRQVLQSEAKEIAEKNGLLYWEVSAKSGVGIQQFFKQMAIGLPGSSVQSTRILSPPVQNPAFNLQNQQGNKNGTKRRCC